MNWISTHERLPEIGQTVITWHQLDRTDMLKFDGENFWFPNVGPVDKHGRPLGFASLYPANVIKFWMPLPASPVTQ